MSRLLTILTIAITSALFLPLHAASKPLPVVSYKKAIDAVKTSAMSSFIYDSIDLESYGLPEEAFRLAYAGYVKLAEKKKIQRKSIITIIDFSQSSREKRFYLIDLENYKVLLNTYVAHGRNSGFEYANRFSNRPSSHQSSLGFYVTKQTYFGEHGLSLVLGGVEYGINDKAERRRIVMHGSRYVGEDYIANNTHMGRSFGCPAIPKEYNEEVINTIKEGTCLFIYHPSKTYLASSKILKGA